MSIQINIFISYEKRHDYDLIKVLREIEDLEKKDSNWIELKESQMEKERIDGRNS